MAKLLPGERVRERREELGLSREQLAQTSKLSTSTIARLELSGKLPNAAGLIRISRALDISLDELVERATA